MQKLDKILCRTLLLVFGMADILSNLHALRRKGLELKVSSFFLLHLDVKRDPSEEKWNLGCEKFCRLDHLKILGSTKIFCCNCKMKYDEIDEYSINEI